MATPTDAELVLAARTDPAAFKQLYERYAIWVRAWFQRETGDEAASLDLTAETFAQAWRGRGRFRDLADGSAAPWLFGIGRNLLRQYFKHDRIETAARRRLGLPLHASADEYELVDDRLAAHALRGRLGQAVSALPGEQQDALQLRVVQQLDYDEVAGRLGCTQNAARLRVSRALRRLSVELEGAQP